MARTFEQVIADAKARQYGERGKLVRCSYRFDIEGKPSYRLEVDHGRLAFTEDSRPADCVIALSPEDFVRVLEGEQNMLTAFMQGRVGIEGDLALAKAFYSAIGADRPQPPAQGEAQP